MDTEKYDIILVDKKTIMWVKSYSNPNGNPQ